MGTDVTSFSSVPPCPEEGRNGKSAMKRINRRTRLSGDKHAGFILV